MSRCRPHVLGALHRLDRRAQIAARRVQQPEPPDAVRLPAGVVYLTPERERVLEGLGRPVQVARRTQTSARSASGYARNAVHRSSG